MKAVRQYEKVASQQKQAACNILSNGASTSSFSTEVKKLHSVQQSSDLSPQVPFPSNIASGIIPMPTISPYINSSAIVL